MANNVKLFDTYGVLYIGVAEFFFDIEASLSFRAVLTGMLIKADI